MKRHLLIKGLSVLSFAYLWLIPSGLGQTILVENFDYTAGSLLIANGWSAHSGSGSNSIDVIVPGLSFTGYPSSNIGGAAQVDNTGEDVNKAFPASTSGALYAAFLIKVNSSSVAGDYFFHFMESSVSTIFKGRVWVKQGSSSTKFYLGVAKTGTTPAVAYSTDQFDVGTTYLLVLKYQFNSSSGNDDVVKLYVNPTLGSSEPDTPTVTASDNTTADFTTTSAIGIRQGGSTTAPNLIFDGVRIAANWTDATSDLTAPAPIFNPLNNATDILTNIHPTITFDEPILKTDGSPVSDGDLTSLVTFNKTDASGAAVAFSATIDASKKVITITPSSVLDNSQLYYLEVGPVEDLVGNESSSKNITFTTIAAATPTVTVTYPDGGEKMYSNDLATVTWTTTNFDAGEGVKIDVWAPNELSVWSWITLVASTSNDGSEQVTVGPNAPYGTEYLIRVSGLTNGASDVSNNPFTVIATATDLATLRQNPVNAIVKFKGIGTITYARSNTYYNQKFIQDATAAVLIHDQPGHITGTYNIGDGITNVEGKITLFNGLMELVPQAATGEPATGTAIIPEVREITSLTSADQSKLVKIEKLKLATPTGNFAAGTSYALEGVLVSAYALYTNLAEANYIGQPVPPGYFNAVVLVHQYNTTIEVVPRNLADITLLSGAKAITSFAFTSPPASGTIDEPGKTIHISVPSGTNVTALVPTIAVSAGSTVSPASGEAQDFTSPVIYTVTAEDGTTQTYTVSVTVLTGIDGINESNIKIYPVPASTELNVINMLNVTNIEILDVTGKVVFKLETNDQDMIKIPVDNLTRGLYFVKFTTTRSKIIKRFIKS